MLKKANILACLMLRRQNEGGERNRNGRRCERWYKIPVKTFPIKKIINTELFIDRNVGALYTKVREGLDQEISDLLEEGRILAGNNCGGSENSGSLYRWTYNYLEEKLNNGSLFETTLGL